jgi:hypothetical protein
MQAGSVRCTVARPALFVETRRDTGRAMALRRTRLTLAAVPLVLLSIWAAAALSIDGPAAGIAAKILAGAWVVLVGALLAVVRPFGRALAVVLVLDLAVLGWWLALEPRNDRNWIKENERQASVRFDGDLVHVRDVRNFQWRSDTDFTPVWEDRTYDLSKIRAADLFLSEWGAPMIAHTIMSWEFEDGQHLAISIETRKEVGEEYSAVLGFFRQFELFYAVADERDVIGVRTNVRGETDHLYRLSASPARARRLLVEYLVSIDELATKPRWYNALTQNCTTTIVRHVADLDGGFAWDRRILANGTADAMLYMRKAVDTSLPFEELRRRSNVTEAARAAGRSENFSALLRRGLPRMDGYVGTRE